MNIVNLYDNYNSYFTADLKIIFGQISKVAAKKDLELYLIGGIVRDMLLDIKNDDIDITVEGDAIEFAKTLEKEIDAKILSIHSDFGTAKIELKEHKLDLASTRSESYPKKGHLPLVKDIGCSLQKDVLRRDFTINSLALSLNTSSFADLIDYTCGFDDLKHKKIRILHDKSFIDDPTRILRALKYSQRLGFEIENETLDLQKKYLENINYDMCYKRVKNELKKTFNENSQKTFDIFIEQEIYKLITKSKIEKPKTDLQKQNTKYKATKPWLVYLGYASKCDDLEKFELTKSEKIILTSAKPFIDKKPNLKTDFDIYKNFSTLKVETLIILSSLGFEKEVCRYLDKLCTIKIDTTGKDLLELKIEPSKKFGEVFDHILENKLKNPNLKKAQEIELAKRFLAED